MRFILCWLFNIIANRTSRYATEIHDMQAAPYASHPIPRIKKMFNVGQNKIMAPARLSNASWKAQDFWCHGWHRGRCLASLQTKCWHIWKQSMGSGVRKVVSTIFNNSQKCFPSSATNLEHFCEHVMQHEAYTIIQAPRDMYYGETGNRWKTTGGT